MPHDPRQCLEDVRKAAERVQAFTGGCDLAHYCGNELLRSAVERQFIIIGEACCSLGPECHSLAGTRRIG